ncbi:MAG: hypothetical protein FJY77_01760, partial [Candidatus Altiarchaeales archaeon]|nr:hypothetical protein [Candidatus Altiarchaeales archaeon]
MFDRLYSQMTKIVDYRVLMVIPPLATVLLALFTYTNGVQFGMDFKGGTWMDVITTVDFDSEKVGLLSKDLADAGLDDPKVYVGADIESGKTKVSIATASLADKSLMYNIVLKYISDLSDVDVAVVSLPERPPGWLEFKLSSRFNEQVFLDYSNGVLKITASDLDESELESVLKYHLGGNPDVNLQKKNFNLREVGPTLGVTFREQGIKAVFLSFVFMAVVVFLAFRVFVPSVAVLQAAVCDVLFALAGMSVFNIPFDSASLGALLMLIGYSVDTDILLTMRLLKEKTVDVDGGIDKAMKTGLMMTIATAGAMVVTVF